MPGEPDQAGIRNSIKEAFDEAGLIVGTVMTLFGPGLLHGNIPTFHPPSTNLGDRQPLLREIDVQRARTSQQKTRDSIRLASISSAPSRRTFAVVIGPLPP
jgi:hypothetical protein